MMEKFKKGVSYMKRILSLLIALAMVVAVIALTACGGDPTDPTGTTTGKKDNTTASSSGDSTTASTGGNSSNTTASSSGDSTTASSGDGTTVSGETELTGKEKHPDFMDVNFGGREFRFSTWKSDDWGNFEISAEATGDDDIVTEAIIARNNTVEKLYNCKIVNEGSSDPTALISNDVQLGKLTYDFCLSQYSNAQYTSDYLNIAALDIDLDRNWWDQSFRKAFGVTVDGTEKLYSISGAFNLISYDATWALFFNTEVYNSIISSGKSNIDLYQAVRDKKWTIDMLLTLMDAAKADANADQQYKYDDGDVLGFITIDNGYAANAFYFAIGGKGIITDENGDKAPISTQNTDISALSAAIDKAAEVFKSPYYEAKSGSKAQAAMSNGQALFVSECLAVAKRVTDENSKYSIVPYPMADENQGEYYTMVCNRGYGLRVSAAVSDYAQTGRFLDVFCYHSEKLVYPEYINFYKTQCFCEDESGEMLDLVLQSRVYDLDYFGMFGINSTMQSYISSGKNMISKAIGSKSSAAKSKLDEYIAKRKDAKY